METTTARTWWVLTDGEEAAAHRLMTDEEAARENRNADEASGGNWTWDRMTVGPCPFCGGNAKVREEDDGRQFTVSCNTCNSHALTSIFVGAQDEQTAIDRWNHRA